MSDYGGNYHFKSEIQMLQVSELLPSSLFKKMNFVLEDADKVMLTTDEDANDNPSDAYTVARKVH